MSVSTVILNFISPLLFASGVSAGIWGDIYTIDRTWIGEGFYDGFQAQAIADPTHGRVNYTDGATARALNLTYAHDDTFILRADDTTVLTPTGPGRNSVRIMTTQQWSTSVIVADVRHMPQGCSTWPALWTDGTSWPVDGEIDIIEGVNDQGTDATTLHTGANCTMPTGIIQTGTQVSTDCNAKDNYNQGCSVTSKDPLSYGPSFNTNGGGWYVMERNQTHVAAWFWHRHDPHVPLEVALGLPIIDTRLFGEPYASFVNDMCDMPSHFTTHNIIINLTLCGDWAGQAAVYAISGCPSTCVDFVNNNPSDFTNAYWDFKALRVYTNLLTKKRATPMSSLDFVL